MDYKEITEKIIGCAFKIHNVLGFGFLESVYENSLFLELKNAGFNVEKQKPIDVYYNNNLVGAFRADLIIDDLIILELKSVQNLIKEFEVQLVNYLIATNKPIGLLINFGPNGVEVKRKLKDLPKVVKKELQNNNIN
jgi:GxxExxY protein